MTPDSVNQFFSFLYQGWLGEVVFWLRFLAGVITSALIAGIVVVSIKMRAIVFRPRAPTPHEDLVPSSELVSAPWQEVRKKIISAYSSDWNLAVIQADSIFDAVLKDMGLVGVTLGDRLKQLDFSKLNSLNDVWEAHKIRNRIAHETDHVLTHEEATRAIALFEKALRELEYLQDQD